MNSIGGLGGSLWWLEKHLADVLRAPSGRGCGAGRLYSIRGGDSPVTGTAASANLVGMRTILDAFVGALLATLRPRASLVAENLVLRAHLAVFKRDRPRRHGSPSGASPRSDVASGRPRSNRHARSGGRAERDSTNPIGRWDTGAGEKIWLLRRSP